MVLYQYGRLVTQNSFVWLEIQDRLILRYEVESICQQNRENLLLVSIREAALPSSLDTI